jgi:hypothetical protein
MTPLRIGTHRGRAAPLLQVAPLRWQGRRSLSRMFSLVSVRVFWCGQHRLHIAAELLGRILEAHKPRRGRQGAGSSWHDRRSGARGRKVSNLDRRTMLVRCCQLFEFLLLAGTCVAQHALLKVVQLPLFLSSGTRGVTATSKRRMTTVEMEKEEENAWQKGDATYQARLKQVLFRLLLVLRWRAGRGVRRASTKVVPASRATNSHSECTPFSESRS